MPIGTIEFKSKGYTMVKTKSVNKISDKLSKVSDSFTVSMYDNGFMLEISGRDRDNEYKTAKIMCTELSQLAALVQEVTEMPRDD